MLSLSALVGLAQPTNGARSIEELTAQLDAHLTDARFNEALWGVKIASLDTGKTIYEHHPQRLMSPASNSKLYAAALALDRLGADYRVVTPILATAQPGRTGKLRGDVIVFGQGDPSWKAAGDAPRFWSLFDPFVAVLREAGVRRVTGDIVADATFLRGPPTGASWTVDDLEDYYGAEISAITLADNLAQLRIAPGGQVGQPCVLELLQPFTGLTLDNRTTTTTNGGVHYVQIRRVVGERRVVVFGSMPLEADAEVEDLTVPHPAAWFAAGLKEALERHGIRVGGEARGLRWPEASVVTPACVTLGEVSSPPLSELVRGFLKPSQNLETDLVFNHLGERARTAATPPWRTSEQLAVRALEAFLATNGLPADELHFDEGSGLSRNNHTTANLTLALLTFMTTHPASNAFLNAMPVAGVDGTLRRRMKGTPAEGNVRAKTGTLRWVNALSGYVTSAARERFVFSLMLNRNVASPGRSGRMELDDIALMLARFQGRSETRLASLHAPHGRLVLVSLNSAPFPHPARASGHLYRSQWYPAADHYSDSRVALFVPNGFREADTVDLVIYFHGWRNSVVGALVRSRLIEQFVEAGKNAVLVVPAGPRNAPDSFAGKLEDADGFRRFVQEILETLPQAGLVTKQPSAAGRIILAGHSGGYRAMAAILDRGELQSAIKEVWVFDGLYGEAETFLSWQSQQAGRLLNVYTDEGGTAEQSQQALETLSQRGLAVPSLAETAATDDTLTTQRVVFLRTELAHDAVVDESSLFKRFLETSCLDAL
jgi:D-alanyl-D-alanine carboxypeptidase/D-alanyl-D-alanine-endopeptidase (penicillin-binding protein 4)